MAKFYFDILEIREWQEGYVLNIGISRPSNAPKFRYTEADRLRRIAAYKENLKLSLRYFKSLSEIEKYVKDLNA